MSRETKTTDSEKLLNKTEKYCTDGFLKGKYDELAAVTSDLKNKSITLDELRKTITENHEKAYELNEKINEKITSISRILKSEIETDSLIYKDFFPVTLTEVKNLVNREKISRTETILKALSKHSEITLAIKHKDTLKNLKEDYFTFVEKIENLETDEKELQVLTVETEAKFDIIYKAYEKLMELVIPK